MKANFGQRLEEKELMDSGKASGRELLRTVRNFSYINLLFSRSRSLLRKHVIKDMDRRFERSFLDLGCGGGDISRWLARYCRRRGLPVSITCMDVNGEIAGYARSVSGGYPEIRVIEGSAFGLKDSADSYDYVFANHFLHHFSDREADELIRIIALKTRRVFLINDLRRSLCAYAGYSIFAGVFLNSGFTVQDGKISIRKGFLRGDMRKLAQKSGFKGEVSVKTALPGRIILTGKCSKEKHG